MRVGEAMSTTVVSVGPEHTLRQATEVMAARRVGAAVVLDPDSSGYGIITERDVLTCLADGGDPDTELVGAHRTTELVYADTSWTLDEAADAMLHGGFRHLVVVSDDGVAGVLSVRDIVRVWTADRSRIV